MHKIRQIQTSSFVIFTLTIRMGGGGVSAIWAQAKLLDQMAGLSISDVLGFLFTIVSKVYTEWCNKGKKKRLATVLQMETLSMRAVYRERPGWFELTEYFDRLQ